MRRHLLVSFLAVLLPLAGSDRLAAQETICGGCLGTGRVTCGACSPAAVGICVQCSGNGTRFDSAAGGIVRCDRCGGSGRCAGCRGAGATCMACKGSGRLPGGASPEPVAREDRVRMIQEALAPFAYLRGRLRIDGRETDGKTFEGSSEVDLRLEGTFLVYDETTTDSDGTSADSSSWLTYDVARREYHMTILAAPGSVLSLRGTLEGKRLALAFADGTPVRLVWNLRAPEGVDFGVERETEDGWKAISEGTLRRRP